MDSVVTPVLASPTMPLFHQTSQPQSPYVNGFSSLDALSSPLWAEQKPSVAASSNTCFPPTPNSLTYTPTSLPTLSLLEAHEGVEGTQIIHASFQPNPPPPVASHSADFLAATSMKTGHSYAQLQSLSNTFVTMFYSFANSQSSNPEKRDASHFTQDYFSTVLFYPNATLYMFRLPKGDELKLTSAAEAGHALTVLIRDNGFRLVLGDKYDSIWAQQQAAAGDVIQIKVEGSVERQAVSVGFFSQTFILEYDYSAFVWKAKHSQLNVMCQASPMPPFRPEAADD